MQNCKICIIIWHLKLQYSQMRKNARLYEIDMHWNKFSGLKMGSLSHSTNLTPNVCGVSPLPPPPPPTYHPRRGTLLLLTQIAVCGIVDSKCNYDDLLLTLSICGTWWWLQYCDVCGSVVYWTCHTVDSLLPSADHWNIKGIHHLWQCAKKGLP